MTISITDLIAPASAVEWLGTLLSTAQQMGLNVTAWQPGGVVRTVLAVVSNALGLEDVAASTLAQAGFLDYAATGTVSFTDANGVVHVSKVSPDPSIEGENPTGATTWIDVLADSVYDVQRILGTYAGGPLAIINTSVATYGPFVASTYHVADVYGTKPGYSNTASLTIAPSLATGGGVTGVVSAAGLIRIQTAAAHGLITGDVAGLVGVTGIGQLTNPSSWYITRIDATRFTLDGSVFSGAYLGGGVVYLPLVATVTADEIGSGSDSVDANGVANVHTVLQPVTSLGGVSVDNLDPYVGSDVEGNVALAARCRLKLSSLSPDGPRGAYEFFALSSQALAPKLSPPLVVGAKITRAIATNDPATGIVTTTIANAVGAPSVGDVAATDAVIQAYAVPDGVTAITQGATENPVSATVTVWVPAAYASTISAIVQASIQATFAALPIGGVTDATGVAPNTNVVPIGATLGAIFSAAAKAAVPLQDAELQLDAALLNIQLAVTEVATLNPAVPVVTVVQV